MGQCAPKPRTARRGRRSGGTWNGRPVQLGQRGLARAVLGGQIFAGMDANVLFGKALGLGSGWKVVKSEMDIAGRELKIWLDFESGSQFACPQCGKFSAVHDTVARVRSDVLMRLENIRLFADREEPNRQGILNLVREIQDALQAHREKS